MDFALRIRIIIIGAALVSGAQAVAQDSIYSHWPAKEATAFDPQKQKKLAAAMEELMTKPVSPTGKHAAKPPEKTSNGWQQLEKARELTDIRDFQTASRAAESALEFARKKNDKRLEMQALIQIGGISREVFLGSSLKAVPYHEQALTLARELQDTAHIIQEYIALADNYGQAVRNEEFLIYALQAVELLERYDIPAQRLSMGTMSGCFFATQGDVVLAEKMFRSAQSIARQIDNPGYVQHLYWQLFSLFIGMGDAERAQSALDSACMVGPRVPESDVHQYRYQLEKLRGNRNQALYHLEHAYQLMGNEYSRRSAEQLAGWETRLRTHEKELQLVVQERNRKLLVWLVLLVSALLLVSAFAWYRQRRIKRALGRQKLLIEQQTVELRQLDQLKSRFFANVSHELRTPLQLILGPVDEVLKYGEMNNRNTALLQAAWRNGRQLLNLVNEILDLSKMQAHASQLQEQPTRLYDFLQALADTFRPLAASRTIALELEFEPEKNLTLMLDRQKLLKIFNNLLGNAIKFTHPGGAIVLRAGQEGDNLLLLVRDTGAGIHPDDLPHIFDLYYQSRRPETQAEGGTGIGLALSRELAEAMGGRLGANSEWGAGSTFFLLLPVAGKQRLSSDAIPLEPEQTVSVARQASPARVESECTARILVVEDNADLQDYLKIVLPAYYCLTVVDNGREAIDRLEQTGELPDLILSDVMMPQMGGFELLEILREHESWRGIPVIILTALADAGERLRAFRIGIDDYIVKPFLPEELIVRIENALRNRAARREWQESLSVKPENEMPEPTDNWLQRLRHTTRENLANPQFNVDELAEQMGIGRKVLYRLVREKTGLSANQFIQELRLLHARELLETGQVQSLREAANAVGLRSSDYFSRLYRERFGKSPATYFEHR